MKMNDLVKIVTLEIAPKVKPEVPYDEIIGKFLAALDTVRPVSEYSRNVCSHADLVQSDILHYIEVTPSIDEDVKLDLIDVLHAARIESRIAKDAEAECKLISDWMFNHNRAISDLKDLCDTLRKMRAKRADASYTLKTDAIRNIVEGGTVNADD